MPDLRVKDYVERNKALRNKHNYFNAVVQQRALEPKSPPVQREPFPGEQENKERMLLLGALADKEFWTQDMVHSADITGKNLMALTAGFIGDLGEFVPGAEHSLASKFPTSEEIAKKIGGDIEHLSWLPAAFIAPGPGELVGTTKAIFGGLIGWATRHGDDFAIASKKYEDFLRLEKKLNSGPMDMRTLKETGWVRGHDGFPKFIIDDSKMTIKEFNFTREGEHVFRAGDIIDHPEFFAAYPDAAQIHVTLFADKAPDGSFVLRANPLKGEQQATFWRNSPRKHDEIAVYGARDLNQLKSTFLHELSHHVQEVEGFSTGASLYTPEYIERLGNEILLSELISSLGQDGLKDRKAVIAFIKQKMGANADPQVVQDAFTAARIYSRLDLESFNDYTAALRASAKKKVQRMAHVFEFVLRKKDPGNEEKVAMLLDRTHSTPDLISDLANQAYFNKLGELEARVAQLTGEWDMTTWKSLKEDPIETLVRTEAGEVGVNLDTPIQDEITIGQLGDRLPKAKDAK